MTGVAYTCPMHRQVQRGLPGTCPLCGMALEPLHPLLAGDEGSELRDMTRRFWGGALLSAPLVLWEHLSMLGSRAPFSRSLGNWLELALATGVVLGAGWPLLTRTWASVRNRALNMFTLIALGVGAAYFYSLAATCAPGVFPPSARRADGSVAVYYEAAAVITVLVLLSQVLELRARSRTSGAVRALLKLAPKTARPLTAAGEEEEDCWPRAVFCASGRSDAGRRRCLYQRSALPSPRIRVSNSADRGRPVRGAISSCGREVHF